MPCQQVSVRRYQWTLPPQSYHLLLCNNGVHDLSWVVPACHDHVLKQHYPTQLGCGNILCFSGVQFHLPYQSLSQILIWWWDQENKWCQCSQWLPMVVTCVPLLPTTDPVSRTHTHTLVSTGSLSSNAFWDSDAILFSLLSVFSEPQCFRPVYSLLFSHCLSCPFSCCLSPSLTNVQPQPVSLPLTNSHTQNTFRYVSMNTEEERERERLECNQSWILTSILCISDAFSIFSTVQVLVLFSCGSFYWSCSLIVTVKIVLPGLAESGSLNW